MDLFSRIKQPIEPELAHFIDLFNASLQHNEGMLGQALSHIRQQGGKRMRPILILLMAKNFGSVNNSSYYAAVGLELLHTASLVHDDVVDESGQRRGQASVNANYDNKVAVLVGDFILSTALLNVSYTHSQIIVQYLAELGRTLSNGEILQLSAVGSNEISEETYFDIIRRKTAALFEACARIGAESADATPEQVEAAAKFGQLLGIIFQIRDDIFDYHPASDIGKPTGNDLKEGKLTLPLIHALLTTGDEDMLCLARKAKQGLANADEIDILLQFAKQNGGIEYAERCMQKFYEQAQEFINKYANNAEVRPSLQAYLDYVVQRKL